MLKSTRASTGTLGPGCVVVAPAAPDAVDEASRPRVASSRVLVLVLVVRVIRRPAHHLSAEPAERVRAVLP
eukprot:SAG25_NODE_1264_length_3458_cov_23.501340_3_plen_70_part_01